MQPGSTASPNPIPLFVSRPSTCLMPYHTKPVMTASLSQVGFHSNKLVKKVRVEKRVNDIVNRLNKTKQELYPDLAAERETYDRGIRAAKKAEVQV